MCDKNEKMPCRMTVISCRKAINCKKLVAFFVAQDRAQRLIANYIVQIGEASGVEYEIHWEYEENTTDTTDDSAETTEEAE